MDIAVILAFAGALLGVGLAVGVLWRQLHSTASWSFAAGMVVLAAESIFAGIAADAVVPDEMVYWQVRRLMAMACLPGTWLLFSLCFARGDYRESLARWRVPLAAAFVAPLALAFGPHGSLVVSIGKAEAGPWILKLGWPGFVLNLIFLVAIVLVLMNLERTYRAAIGTMRWRIKFMIFGLGFLFGVRAYFASQVVLFHAINLSLQAVNCGALLLGCLLILCSLPRGGQFEVNVYPSPLVLHRSLTVMLAGVYLLMVGVLARVVVLLGRPSGLAAQALLVLLALVTLALLLSSNRVRLLGKRFLSRNLQRPHYDYRGIWRSFTEATAHHVQQRDLCEAVVKPVSEMFHALSTNLWLVDDHKQGLVLAASTSLSLTKAEQFSLEAPDAELVFAGLRAHPAPLDMDSSKEVWAAVLRRLHPDEFRQGGNRLCVPIMAGNELLGVMTLGDRVAGTPYSLQDFDLLKCIADQAAASLLNIRLSQKLSEAKQLEAFQAMSTFFVHDLKNTASTLSLMLQNLPVHFNDPKFREDALRGISTTVTHLNDLIGRLSQLRQEVVLRQVESDLNVLVTEVLKRFVQTPGIELAKELRSVAKVRLDPVQIQNVITNLVLNARDAVIPAGQIRVETIQRNGWTVLSVSDNGCGMTPEFLQRCLFRPFQTTKRKGLGIGMFQSKLIVEAHQGKIEVESEPGKGSTFRVLLPLHP